MFSHLPKLTNIRAFEAAARLMSFKAASIELNLTPTAISHQITNLEDKLGVQLFERRVRSVALTPEGEQLMRVAHQALQQLSSTIEDISVVQSVLRVSTTASFAAMWLVPNLAKFQEQYPNIQVEIKTGEQQDDLQTNRRIDVAIRYGHPRPEDKAAIPIATECFTAFATPEYLHRLSCLSEARLIGTQWKNPNLSPISWEQWYEEFNANEPTPAIHYFDQEQHMIQAALAGQGIMLASSILVEMPLAQGWLVPFQEECSLSGFSYSLLTSPHSAGTHKVEAFTQWLISELGETAPE